MLNNLCLSFLMVTLVLGGGSGVTTVRAQEVALVAQDVQDPIMPPVETTEQPQVFEKPELKDQIADVQRTYRSQLEQYRTADRRYQIAKEQYLKLNTLASLEEAVTATREAMIKRDEVLLSFFTLLRLQLIDATGINLTQKEPALADIETLIGLLEEHKVKVGQASDRYLLSPMAEQFAVAAPEIEAVAYRALSLLAVGKLQTVYDKSLILNQELKDNLSSGSADIKKAERERAQAEITNELQQVRPFFDKSDAIINRDASTFQRSAFTQVLQQLGSVYAGLSQSLAHMNELLRL